MSTAVKHTGELWPKIYRRPMDWLDTFAQWDFQGFNPRWPMQTEWIQDGPDSVPRLLGYIYEADA